MNRDQKVINTVGTKLEQSINKNYDRDNLWLVNKEKQENMNCICMCKNNTWIIDKEQFQLQLFFPHVSCVLSIESLGL